MKKLTIGIAALLAGYGANSFANISTTTGNLSRCAVSVPSYCGGFTFGVAGLYWRATSAGDDFGLTSPSFTGDEFSFDGSHHHNRSRYDWGWQANAGYLFPCSGNDVNFAYTHWDHSRHHHLDEGVFTDFFPFTGASFFTPGSFIFSPSSLTIVGTFTSGEDTFTATATVPTDLSFTVTVAPEDVTAFAARSNFKNDTWDLSFGQAMNVGCNFNVRWFGGLRYSRLKQHNDVAIDATGLITAEAPGFTAVPFTVTNAASFSAVADTIGTLFFDATAAIHEAVNQKSDFNGIGPRFGVDVNYNIGCGFGVVGSLSTSLLVGEIESKVAAVLDVGAPTEPLGTTTVKDLSFDSTTIDSFEATVTANGLTGLSETISFRHPDETRVVPNIDAKLGVDWVYQFCGCSHTKLSVEAGYLVSHYFNAIDRFSPFTADFGTRHNVDVSFDGPYVGVQVAL